MIAYTCKYWNISVVSVVFIEIFPANQQYDTLLPIIHCRHKLKAGIAYWIGWNEKINTINFIQTSKDCLTRSGRILKSNMIKNDLSLNSAEIRAVTILVAYLRFQDHIFKHTRTCTQTTDDLTKEDGYVSHWSVELKSNLINKYGLTNGGQPLIRVRK